MTEIELQRLVLNYLRVKKIFHWRNNNIASRGRKFIGLRGVADIIAVKDGVFYAIEIKSPDYGQSVEQKMFQFSVVSNGGQYILVKSFEDIAKIFK